jgi:transposase
MERGSRRAPTQACPKGSAHRMGLKQWLHEGVKVDWEKLLAPKGFVVLPRRWVVERSFAWISHNRRMRVRTTRGYVCGRGSVRICCHDSPDGEAVGSLMRRALSPQVGPEAGAPVRIVVLGSPPVVGSRISGRGNPS